MGFWNWFFDFFLVLKKGPQKSIFIIDFWGPFFKTNWLYSIPDAQGTLYYKVLLQYYSVLQSTSPVLPTPVLLGTTKYYSSTTLYYKVSLQYYSLCTTKRHSSATLYYQIPTPVLQSTTPVLLCTKKYYPSTTLYYKVLLQYYSVLQSTTPVLLCTTELQYYSVLQNTTLYYKVLVLT